MAKAERRVCVICGRDEDEVRLLKCPICFRLVCPDHAHKMSGREFCSKACAEYFFFGDPEEEE